MSKCAVSAVAAVAVLLQPTSACDILHVGRIAIGIDGLSDQCCNSIEPTVTKIVDDIKIGPHGPEPDPAEAQEGMQLVKGFADNCCGDADQDVLATALPNKFTQAKGGCGCKGLRKGSHDCCKG